jgi:hypothetical protein
MSSPRPELRLDWCSHEAAKYAVEKWHYSRVMPAGKLTRVGVWEDGQFIGCVLFGRGAIYRIGDPFGLPQTAVVELVRVALAQHRSAVSRIGSIAIRMLMRQAPGLRLLVSYADAAQGHLGTIYQAMGWIYTGATATPWKRVNGVMVHPRSLYSRYGTHDLAVIRARVDSAAEIVPGPPKHKYLYPLDDAMRAQIAPLARPYPKRAKHPSDAPAVQAGEGGAAPTRTLHEVAV